MKVKMLKAHQGFKKDEIVEVEDARGRYWIGCSVAKKTKTRKVNKK